MRILPGTKLQWPLTCAAIIACLAIAAVLYRYDPAANAFYPKCIFRQLTGYNCPGCGTARACYQLLHGHIGAAADYNLMTVLLLPLLLTAFMARTTKKNMPAWWYTVMRPLPVLAVIIIFWIVRNSDIALFAWLNADK